ncbi:MAG: HAD hydrolase-like protein [Pseudonocardiaceae bacterium]|nr:HAD hydrolase-like protein [Pseudonocardiaceae bacterium]
MAFTVGFDLDMTLIDPRPGMVRVLAELSEESGVPLDGEHFAANLGPPLDHVLLHSGVPEDRVPELVARFREMYPDIVIPRTVPLPGAVDALDAVHRLGGRSIVVTGKYRPNAEKHLHALDFRVNEVIGELWSTGKGAALRELGARIYVGDHLGDVRGARAADALSVAVATGPCSRAELLEAGADVVLDDLLGFPEWLADNVDAR